MDRYTVTTPPSGEPVTLNDVKAFLRITHDAEDALIQSFIVVATEQLEAYTRRVFIERTFRGEFDKVLCSGEEVYPFVKVKRSPLLVVSSVQASRGGVFADVEYQLKMQPAFSRVLFPDSIFSLDDTPFPLRIDFTAGYGDAADVPAAIKTAIMQYVNYLYSNRGDCAPECGMGIPVGVRALVSPYKIIDTFTA